MHRTLRVRLTLWYVGVLAAILMAFGLGFYWMLDRNLRQRLDSGLRSAMQVTALALNHETEEHLGKAPGEENVRMVMNTMHQTSFPRPDLSVWDGERLVAEKPGSAGLAAAKARELLGEGWGQAAFRSVRIDGGGYRIGVSPAWVSYSQTRYLVVASESTGQLEEELRTVLRVLVVLVPVFLLLAASGGYFLARKSLEPVLAMAREADQISSHNLNQRLTVDNAEDELGLLAQTFNRMFKRLQNSFGQQRQFMADASHELRTPVSVALTATQVSLENRDTPREALLETLEVVQSQMLRLRRVVEDMFMLAQADSGVYRPEMTTFYLDEVLQESARAGRVLGNAKGVTVTVRGTVGEALFRGDEGLIRQLLLILIDNAVKYTAGGGRVDLTLGSEGGAYRIRVSDTGCGVAEGDRDLIFRRFYRADKSRSRRQPGAGSGAGLGLAIAQWIVELHAGRVALESSSALGSVFLVELPLGLAEVAGEVRVAGRAV
ncbi:MAG: HAMP domain-containing protein [Bryobacterales bacterium]|nr:HAMP domain-containing protein [Bryobacterales bacterium]